MPTKILAIDDSKTMRLAVKITFAAEDAEVTSVGKGGDAVARAKQLGADIVLVDHDLGDGEPSGYDVCQALKSDAGTSSIPVLMLVSNKTGADEARLKQVGGDGYIAKPFDTQQLIDKVAELVGKPAAKPAAAARPAAAAPAPARPAVAPKPAVAATPAPRPVAKPAAPAPAPRAAAAAPKPAAAPRPAAAAAPAPTPARPAARSPQRTQMGMPTPAPKPPPGPNGGSAQIPIAIPIPFTAASSPTAGMVERIQKAASGAGGELDPQVAAALASLSHEVVERIVWEVVPELAESLIREKQASL